MNRKQQIGTWWQQLRERPVLYNIVKILGVMLVISVIAYMVLAFGTRHGMEVEVTDYSGIGLDEAREKACGDGVKIVVNDSLYVSAYPGGTVLEQLPKAGSKVKKGRKVYVTINSYHQRKVPVPYVAGRSLRQARNMLENAGLQISEIRYAEDIATNYVLSQYVGNTEVHPESHIKIEKGSGVRLIVGVEEGYSSTTVPRLTSRTLHDAKNRLWENGLNVGTVEFEKDVDLLHQEDARVCHQSILHGAVVGLGTRVSLRLTLDAKKIESGEKDNDASLKHNIAVQDSLANVATADSVGIAKDGIPFE